MYVWAAFPVTVAGSILVVSLASFLFALVVVDRAPPPQASTMLREGELSSSSSTPPASPLQRPSRQSTPMRPLGTSTSTTPNKKQQELEEQQNWILLVTYLNIALYAMCYQLQRPVEPFLVQQLAKGGSPDSDVPRTYGRLQAFFSAIQTVGSPLVGILLDRVGVRLASTIVFLSSAASYVLLAGATTLPVLFLSKVPTALQHAFLVAQATAAVATSGAHPDARAAALGRMTTAYTVGATIGPIVGGILADRGDLYAGAKLAVMGSLLSAVLSLAFLPNEAERRQHGIKSQKSFMEEVGRAGQLALRPTLGPLMAVKVLGGVASSMHQTALPLVLTQRLQYDPAELGLVMSASMFAVAAFGALGTAPLIRRYGAQGLVRLGLVSRSFLVLVLSLVVSLAQNRTLLASQVPVSMGTVMVSVASHALATSLTTLTTGSVDRDEQGALLGLEHGLFSLARIAGPPLGTFMLATSGFSGVSVACGLVDVGMVALFSVVVLGMTSTAVNTKSATSTGAATPARKAKD